MEELEVDEELKKDIKEEIRQSLKAFESVPEEKTDEKNLDALLERLMKDYHNLRLTEAKVCDRINTYFHMVEWLCDK